MLIYELAMSSMVSSCMKTTIGSYHLIRQARPESRWKVPGVREFDPHWVVRFCLPGEQKRVTAKLYAVCERCLAVEGNPVEVRGNCSVDGCQRDVRRWADLELAKFAKMLREGGIKASEEWLRPKQWTPFQEVLGVYLQRGPKDRRQRVNFLATIFTQTTGKPFERMGWEDLTRDLVYDWIELRQEAGRRGWLGLGAGKNMPVGGWDELRELQRAKRLRRDTKTVAPWNTTILGHVVSAKSIFHAGSRDDVLRGLRIPPLEDFLAVKLSKMLPVPKGHREIDEEVMRRIVAEMPALRAEKPRVWAFVLVCAWLSGRPGKVLELAGEALKVLPDGTGMITQPEAKGGNESFTLVDAECVEAVLAVRTVGSLFGARHATDAKVILNQANEWLTCLGMEGSKKMSMFRHHKLQLLRNEYGDEMAAAAAGHTTTAMVRSTYTRNEKVVPLVNPFTVEREKLRA